MIALICGNRTASHTTFGPKGTDTGAYQNRTSPTLLCPISRTPNCKCMHPSQGMCRTGPPSSSSSSSCSSTSSSPPPGRPMRPIRRRSSSASSLLLLATKVGQPRRWPLRRLFSLCLSAMLLTAIWATWRWGSLLEAERTTVIVITPTHKRPERLADMTRFSQTLMHVSDLHWIVIEDSNATVPAVERILQRSRLPYAYFFTTTKPGFPRRGWTHRNVGLDYVRKHYAQHRRNAVVYFADDDNSYDIRLFERYIKRVRSIGIWAVGLAGAALVEAPHVENGTITGWDVVYAPQRRFATDMAGFAINLQLILNTNASFNSGCVRYSPESCFLAQFGIPRHQVEPFGWDERPKEILVWHTKTKNIGTKGKSHGYVVET